MTELTKFSEGEVEELLSPPKKTLLRKVLDRVENVIQAYPVHTLGLTFAIGVLIGAVISNSKSNSQES
ncbi:hypothetical protein KEJ50_07120 [Candidatus Bathyarchaeota archaeon]|nr:hypothetical protein [Candidatus Bathyarchaeota archaeon]